MKKKELRERTLHREELLVKYQLAADFVRQLSIVCEKSPGLFEETVIVAGFKRAVDEMTGLKDRILTTE
jgi:hypothetical protein